jgi:uncharacterized membrane protein (UPF0127 family)
MLVLALVSLLATPAVADDELERAFERTSIVIEAADAACYGFDVYLAFTNEQQRRGLMHVRQLPRFMGMLFVYHSDDFRSMWMKNTFIPLDILFIRSDGTVSSVEAMNEPLTLTSIASVEPVRYVLELNGGLAAELGIDAGSIVYLPEL